MNPKPDKYIALSIILWAVIIFLIVQYNPVLKNKRVAQHPTIQETSLVDKLVASWPEIEQGPLLHDGESGHWFLNEIEVIGPDRVIAWYEDGLNDQFAVLEYQPEKEKDSFVVLQVFQGTEKLPQIIEEYGTPGWPLVIYRYDNQRGSISLATSSLVFSAAQPQPQPQPEPGTETGLVSKVKIALLNPQQNLENETQPGDISGCDSVVLVEKEIEPTQAPLTASIRFLIEWKEVFRGDHEVINHAARGDLSLDYAEVENGTAKIYLSGQRPAINGVCDEPRLFVQVAQTARQFSTVQKVEVYVNGQKEPY